MTDAAKPRNNAPLEIDVAVADGRVTLGRIVGKRPKFTAFDADGKELGTFQSQVMAVAAIHQKRAAK